MASATIKDEGEEIIKDGSSAFVEAVNSLTTGSRIQELKSIQVQLLGRLQEGNAVLSQFNDYSALTLSAVGTSFANNGRLLRSMRSDLDQIFRRIRSLKDRIAKHYPEAFQEVLQEVVDERPDLEETK